MRTTIDISTSLAIRAKKVAIERHTTLKALAEEGLRLVLLQPSQKNKNPLEQLKGLGKNIWKDIDPDKYIQQLRADW